MHFILTLDAGLILAFLTAMVKFLFAVPTALVAYNMTFVEGLIFAFSGGFSGVLAFLFLSKYILSFFDFLKSLIFKPKPKKKKIFTRQRRAIVAIKAQYGLIGLAFITPCIISIPVGTILAVRFYHNKGRIAVYMAASVLFWSVVFSAIFTGLI